MNTTKKSFLGYTEKDFSATKMIRFIIAATLVLSIYALVFGTGLASAETGTITVADYTTKDTLDAGGIGVDLMPNFSYLGFFNTSYTAIDNVRLVNTSDVKIVLEQSFESTTFTCTAGGTCSGVFYYTKNPSIIKYVFDSGSVFTSNVINLSFASNITKNISFSYVLPRKDASHIDATFPVCVKDDRSGIGSYDHCFSFNYTTVLSSYTTDAYNVTYSGNLFSIAITKGKTVEDRWDIMSHSYDTYTGGLEPSYNKNDSIFTNDTYNGIIVNVSLASGGYTIKTINLSGTPNFTAPVTVDPATGAGIQFDDTTYLIGDTANISWNRTSATPFGYSDDIYLIQPGNIKKILSASPPNTGTLKTNDFPIAGEYKVNFERSILGLNIEVLASDTANIEAEHASYIIVNSSVPVGVYTTGKYLSGWTGTGRIVIYQDAETGTKEIDSLAITGVCCVENTVSQLFFPEPGNYRVVLMKGYDTVRATSSVTAYLSDIVPGANITVSNISLNKAQYTYGEPYTISYQVDSTNYSNKAKRIIAYEIATGANTLINIVPSQTGTITRTFDSEAYPFSGSLQLRLMGLNASGDYLLAYVNFTLSKIDTEGYGLDVTKTPICLGEIGYYTYYSPGSVNIVMSNNDITVYSKNFTAAVSGKTVPFTIKTPGNYEIFLRPSNQTDVKFTKTIEVKACDAAIGTTPTTQAKAQNDIAIMLTSSFVWALIITVGLMIAVAVEIRGKMANPLLPMAATGFLSIAVFTWLTWIPAVVFWSIVLLLAVIFAWQRSKDMNTAGE